MWINGFCGQGKTHVTQYKSFFGVRQRESQNWQIHQSCLPRKDCVFLSKCAVTLYQLTVLENTNYRIKAQDFFNLGKMYVTYHDIPYYTDTKIYCTHFLQLIKDACILHFIPKVEGNISTKYIYIILWQIHYVLC